MSTPLMSDVQAIVDRAKEGEANWAATSLTDRRQLLKTLLALVDEHSAEWVAVATTIKQIPKDSPLVGEEWISGPYAMLGYIQALLATLERLDTGVDVLSGYTVSDAPGDRLAVEVLPHDIFEKLLLSGFSAQVWTRPGVSRAELHAGAGLAQRNPGQTNGVALVLGAGNIFSIAPLDILAMLFADNRTAILKLNPVTEPLLGVFGTIFKPFIDLGVVTIVTGDADIGGAFIDHPEVTAVHMTGSEHTYNAIVWGTGEEATANRAAGTPKLTKPMSAELGGISPVIIVPGEWSAADIEFQANHVATMRLHNGGFNCIAAQIVMLSRDWAQKEEFLTALRKALASAPARPAWYPGCDTRVADARATYADAEAVGGTAERTLITGLELTDEESALSTEYFAPVLGVAELPGTGADFMDAAVAEANEHLHGTLGANVVVEPGVRKAMGDRFDDAIAALAYGTVGINAWTGVGYLTGRATWGAYPGHTPEDVQSGIGVVHNALLLDDTERTVITGPFRPIQRSLIHGEMAISPKPPWFVNNRTQARTGELLAGFTANPGWARLPAIFASALRG